MATNEDTPKRLERRVTNAVRYFEHGIVLLMMGLLMAIITISTLELGWILIQDLTTARRLVLDVEEMLELFGFFLLVLIGMELLVSLKAYLFQRVIHVEVVLEVAIIAMAQKVIIMDTSRTGAPVLFAVAGIIVALAVSFFAVRAARSRVSPPAGERREPRVP